MKNLRSSDQPAREVPARLVDDPTWERLEDQIGWYDRKSKQAQQWYKRLKLLELAVAASLPVLVGVGSLTWVPAGLSALIVILEGIQHLYQHQEHWITYRSTCEALRHERFLYLAHAGPYASAKDPGALLAERIEGLVSQEHARWASSQQQEPRT